ncbi:protein MAIN-LIKE 1-like [Actinidia eriantha]|uniref:protein MAIN-LIKE 1-like n=1 Tax=Actinidia eriantha TaxID=165200 RepID=UPI00258B95C3|nr:protein MAIN-LIKE 1-like [Actinidia eriantha]
MTSVKNTKTRPIHQSQFMKESYKETANGPNDMTVLYLQDQHQFEDIWSGQGDDLVIVRQPHLVYDLDERVRPFVIAFGFYEISRIRGINLDHGLISTLLEQWRCETHTFHLRVGEMTPTLQDVAMLTGLPIDGAPVIGPGRAV